MTTAAKFEVTKDISGKLRFHLKAANGEIIASGQGYKIKASAEKGIEAVKTSASAAKVLDLTAQEAAHN
ncbi:YegP family protein [Mycobacterium sp.]|uniref:YegP family protein n=1 Tax=Mycobacterium sp. TaxID=1785 RepID=UPI003F814E26